MAAGLKSEQGMSREITGVVTGNLLKKQGPIMDAVAL
jgi:hypothetical protein